MAGDIQEPLRLSFQGDYFHSGSISFGKYETESLCWERRSSFSHNRYLEEVVRCSTPGLVTEKKAYFEAHFKRKALLNKATLESQSRVDSKTRKDEKFLNNSDEDNVQHLAEEIHKTSCDKNLAHSVPDKEVDVDQAEAGCEDRRGSSARINGVLKNEAKEILTGCGEAATSKKSSKPCSSPATEIRNQVNEESDSPTKVKTWSEMILEISELMAPEPSVVKAKRSVSSISSKDFVTKPVNREYHTSSRSRMEKQIPDSTLTTMRSVSGTLKTLASQNSKTKLNENKSFILAKKSTSRSTAGLRPSAPEKVGPGAQQTANRQMKAANSAKPIMKQNGSAFGFKKSDQRADRRKEYEEKMLAKENEAQEVKTKKKVISPSKEKTEADMKQLRKSLDFKATPMPSFYTEDRRSLDRSKVVASNYKTSKIQSKPSSPGAGSLGKHLSCQSMRSCDSEAYFTMHSRRDYSIQVSGEISHPAPVSSDNNAKLSELADADNNRHPTRAAADKALISKHRHKEVSKGRKIEGMHKVGDAARTKGIARKDIKSSRTGSLAVDVSS